MTEKYSDPLSQREINDARRSARVRGPQPNTPAWHRRQRIWRHNSFIGHSVMMRQQLQNIIDAQTTTAHTKQLAKSMLGLVTSLQNSLQERVD